MMQIANDDSGVGDEPTADQFVRPRSAAPAGGECHANPGVQDPNRHVRRRRRSSLLRTAAASALLVTGAMLATATQGWAVENGTTVTDAEQQQLGLVHVDDPTCSGVLIANDWLLTAGHCAVPKQRTPGSLVVTLGKRPPLGTPPSPAFQAANADAIYLFAGFADEVGPDIALVHLNAPFQIKGSTSGFSNRLWPGTPDSLINPKRTVAMYGQGTSCPDPDPAGVGTYRAADLKLTAIGLEPSTFPGNVPNPPTGFHSSPGGRYHQLEGANNRITAPGDSGGPAFIWQNNVPYIIGINSAGGCGSSAGYQVSIPSVRDWVAAVLKTQWVPGSTGQNVWVLPAEVAGTNWPVTDVNNTGWAQAARAAAAMCYSRGYAGGHFDGQQGQLNGNQGFGILCAGDDTAWFDVEAREIAAQTWKITDVDKDNWAAAGRAAQEACSNRGFVGGQFSGHHVASRYGLFCYKKNAQHFDATDAQLAATGWGFPTPVLDNDSWAQAARAAAVFCQGQGFSGGFMTGHQIPNKYGVTCQKP